VKQNYFRILIVAAGSATLFSLLAAYALAASYVYLAPDLPSSESMRKVELQIPLRVYTRNGALMAQIGEQRRIPVTYEQIPLIVKQAFLAAEDERFFTHHGIDFAGVLRAVFVDLVSGDRTQGASTITMQAARNMFLSQDKTWRRKLQETFLTYRMEHEFTKEEIFGLYLNVIFFGQRAYGVAAAAETFFGKTLDQLTVAEAATLGGIPKAPSRYNPIVNPRLATGRRSYVLRRMLDLRFVDAAAAQNANQEPMLARVHAPLYDVEAPDVAEMARLDIRARFGPAAETAGYRVYTTVDGRLQTAAIRAVRIGLIEYDRRHGWRGPLAHKDLGVTTRPEFEALLDQYATVGDLSPAVVVSVADKAARAFVKSRDFAQIDWDGLAWARREIHPDVLGPAPKNAHDILSPGDVVYVVADGGGSAQLAQPPAAQSALVALDPNDGAIAALVGGFDFFANKFNRATQARRLPGSGFKPFLYSGALEDGFTPASVLLDAPIVLEGDGLETAWRPENSTGDFHGPMRLREALVRSRNLVSIRLLRAMGTQYAIDYVTRFGFNRASLPTNLTLALGTVQATPLEIATGYAVFANGGYRVQPYFIDRIENAAGQVVWRAAPRIACDDCVRPADTSAVTASNDAAPTTPAPARAATTTQNSDSQRSGPSYLAPARLAERVISPQNDYLMTDMMMDVIKRGTGHRAMALGRTDLAGKTGTTNEARDTWFNGFTRNLVVTVWVGFDQERPLGESEEGAKTALPIWMHFMREALRGVPEWRRPMPDGLIQLRISPQTGMLASAENPEAISETFMVDHLPTGGTPGDGGAIPTSAEGSAASEPIF
jgi:penicillin-binding protein 1A